MATKEDVIIRAQKRAEKAKDLLSALHDLHREGRITIDSLIHISSAAESGFPYSAQKELERILAKQILEESFPHEVRSDIV